MQNVIVLIGAGQIGQAIARRVGIGKHVLLADVRTENAAAAAGVLSNAGYEVSTATVDVSSRDAVNALAERAASIGDVTGLIHAAGVSPSQASPATVLEVDLYGTALVLEAFGSVIARGGSGVVISSQSGHRLPAFTLEQNRALAMTPATSCSRSRFCSSTRSGTRCTRTSSRSAATRCARWPRRCAGGSAARGSTRSVRSLMDGGVTASYWYGDVAEVR